MQNHVNKLNNKTNYFASYLNPAELQQTEALQPITIVEEKSKRYLKRIDKLH